MARVIEGGIRHVVSVYEQDCCGTIHWRVMRNDGRLIFDRHQTDFPSRDEAVAAIAGEFRRKSLGVAFVDVYTLGRELSESFTLNEPQAGTFRIIGR